MSEAKKLSWPDVRSFADDLVMMIRSSEQELDYAGIVAISNGGLIPACLIAKQLDMKVIGAIAVSAFDPDGERLEKPMLLTHTLSQYKGKKLLVVDDLADTGATLQLVVNELSKVAERVDTAVLIRKHHAQFTPTFFLPWSVEGNDEWLEFPWED